MYSYVVSAHKPSAVRHAVKGNFTAADHTNLLIGKHTRLEVLILKPEGFQTVLDIPVFGQIASMHLFRPQGETKDLLFIMTAKFAFFVVGFDESRHQLVIKTSGTLSDIIGRPIENNPIVSIDPFCRAIGLHLYEGLLKFIPFDSKNQLKKVFNVRIDELNVIDFKFLHNRHSDSPSSPTVAVLFEDAKRNRHVKTYVVNLDNGTLADGSFSHSNVDATASLLIPIPMPYGGFVVVGDHQLLYLNAIDHGKPQQPLALNLSYGVSSTFSAHGQVFSDGSRWLLGDTRGDLWLFTLRTELGRIIDELALQRLGRTSLASSIVYLGNEFVFIGSTMANSQLIQLAYDEDTIEEQRGNSFSNTAISIIEEFPNLGPIVDLVPTRPLTSVHGDEWNHDQIITLSGGYFGSSIRSIRTGFGFDESGRISIPGIRQLFTIFGVKKLTTGGGGSADEENDKSQIDLILMSFHHESRVIGQEKQAEFGEINLEGFESNHATLFAANFRPASPSGNSPQQTATITREGRAELTNYWMQITGHDVNIFNHDRFLQKILILDHPQIRSALAETSSSSSSIHRRHERQIGQDEITHVVQMDDNSFVIVLNSTILLKLHFQFNNADPNQIDMQVENLVSEKKASGEQPLLVLDEICGICRMDHDTTALVYWSNSYPIEIIQFRQRPRDNSSAQRCDYQRYGVAEIGGEILPRSLFYMPIIQEKSRSPDQESQTTTCREGYLLIGMGDGRIVYYHLSFDNSTSASALSEIHVLHRKEITIGRQPITLLSLFRGRSRVHSESREQGPREGETEDAVFVCCEKPSILYLAYSNMVHYRHRQHDDKEAEATTTTTTTPGAGSERVGPQIRWKNINFKFQSLSAAAPSAEPMDDEEGNSHETQAARETPAARKSMTMIVNHMTPIFHYQLLDAQKQPPHGTDADESEEQRNRDKIFVVLNHSGGEVIMGFLNIAAVLNRRRADNDGSDDSVTDLMEPKSKRKGKAVVGSMKQLKKKRRLSSKDTSSAHIKNRNASPLQKKEELQIREIKLGGNELAEGDSYEMGRRLAYSDTTIGGCGGLVAIITSKVKVSGQPLDFYSTSNPEVQEQMERQQEGDRDWNERYYVKLFDAQTFELLVSYALQPSEWGSSALFLTPPQHPSHPSSASTPSTEGTYLLVGTGYVRPEEYEPTAGRLLLFAILPQSSSPAIVGTSAFGSASAPANQLGVSVVAEIPTKGAVYSLLQLSSSASAGSPTSVEILAGINGKVQYYSITDLFLRPSSSSTTRFPQFITPAPSLESRSQSGPQKQPQQRVFFGNVLVLNMNNHFLTSAANRAGLALPSLSHQAAVDDDEFLVADLMKSVTLMRRNRETNVLDITAHDYNITWITASEFLSHDYILATDTSGNLIVFRKKNSFNNPALQSTGAPGSSSASQQPNQNQAQQQTAGTDLDSKKLDIFGRFHIGDSVNRIRIARFFATNNETSPQSQVQQQQPSRPSAMTAKTTVASPEQMLLDRRVHLLLGTVNGSLGVVFPFADQYLFELLDSLQKAISQFLVSHGSGKEVDSEGGKSGPGAVLWLGTSPEKSRNFESAHKLAPARNVIDGDLIEEFWYQFNIAQKSQIVRTMSVQHQKEGVDGIEACIDEMVRLR